VQDANGTNICHVGTAIIKTTFEICDLCNNSIHEDCCELANSLTTCYACIGHTHINNQKDQSSNELENTVEQANTSAAIKNKDNKNQSNNNIPENTSQLRSKELKLKKWEQDLELKEKLLNENSKDCTKLMNYVTKLENQNQELNMHIMTLQRRIEQIEEKTTHKVQTNDPQHHDYHTINKNLAPDNNSLLHSIQYRVTSSVLKQIDKQLQQLENNMVTTIIEQKTCNTDSKCQSAN
jgi:chromosome segregation ATPase